MKIAVAILPIFIIISGCNGEDEKGNAIRNPKFQTECLKQGGTVYPTRYGYGGCVLPDGYSYRRLNSIDMLE